MSYDPTPGPTDYPAGFGSRPTGPASGWNPAPSAASTAAGRSGGLAVGGFVCAAVGAVAAIVPYIGILGFPVILVGLVLSVIGLIRGRAHRSLAIAGLVVSLVALPIDALVTTATLSTISAAGAADSTSSSTPDTTTATGGSGSTSPSGRSTGSSSARGYSSGGYSSGSGTYSAADLAYLATLSRYGVTVDSNAEAINYGHAVCRYYDAGGSPYNLQQNLLDSGFTSYETGVIIGAAEGAYCP